jgi:alcohol dehydrogenase class IV
MAGFLRVPQSPIPTEEVHGKLLDFASLDSSIVSYGLPFDETLARHVPAHARVFVLTGRTLSKTTDSLDRLRRALGDRIKGVRVGISSHTPFDECLEASREARRLQADTVISLGSGSISDAAKMVALQLMEPFETVEELATRDHAMAQLLGQEFPVVRDERVRLILIPTTLSAGEHNPVSGVTDTATRQKYQIFAPAADLVILDPWLSRTTPPNIWLQSGVRGIDHITELFCSADRRVESDQACLAAAKFLLPALLAAKQDQDVATDADVDLQLRLDSLIGVAMTTNLIRWGVTLGASHGIGHMLGPLGIGHGETSCILLPAVCKYNAPVNGEQQARLAACLWEMPECEKVFQEGGIESKAAAHDLSDLLDRIIRRLGLPRSLAERNLNSEETMQMLAKTSMHDQSVHTNPRKIESSEDVLEILRMVRG